MLEEAIADGTFCEKSVERFQKSSFDVLLRLSQTESYYERFKSIIEPKEVQHESPAIFNSKVVYQTVLPVPQALFGPLTQNWYPDGEPENTNRKMTAREEANAELHSLVFGPKM